MLKFITQFIKFKSVFEIIQKWSETEVFFAQLIRLE